MKMIKRMTAAQIAAEIMDGWVCFSDIGVSNPPELTDALAARAAAGEITFTEGKSSYIHNTSWFQR